MVDKTNDDSLDNKDLNTASTQESIDNKNAEDSMASDTEVVAEVLTDGDDTIADQNSSVNSKMPTVKLEDEIKKSFIDYAMSVIVDRALPDVRDGLKPVHRRVLYDMYDLKIWYSGQTKKSARVVGDVIGRFHPHGDAAVYETIVRMTQWFSMRAPLIFGQGNFGNIDGDGAAAMRYTEIKMTKIAEMMLQDIDKETVDSYPNYDGNEQIPEVLPTRFPNLLVNGASGIAVGMATNIPPHNLSEVIDGSIALLDNPDLSLDEIMRYIPGPDFPTGGFIVGNSGIKEAYATGRGRCIMRARTHVEEDKSGRKTIYVDEIPFVVNKSAIVKQIADLVHEKKIEGIAEVNDLSDKDNLVRIAIDLKRDAYAEAVLNNLFDKTQLQTSFAMNMIALVGNHPKLLSLKEILSEFVSFRREVVTRRTVYMLRQDRRKAFLNEGLIVAKANINKIVDMITSSANAEDARHKLMSEPWDGALIGSLIVRAADGSNICMPSGIEVTAGLHDGKYYLSEEQARAILAMQLQRLTHLASDEIQADYKALIENIKGYLEILNNPVRMNEVIRDELIEVKNTYGDKRRSDFIEDYGKRSKGDFIAKQDVVITLSGEGYIKYQDISSYEAARNRGGKGRAAAKLKDEDYISNIVVANTHDHLICFTSHGRAFSTLVFDLPTSENRTWRGRPIQNLFEIEEGEKITALLPISEFDESRFIFMATQNGMVKKTRLSEYRNFIKRSNGQAIKAINLAQGDELIGAQISTGDDDIFLFTTHNRAIHFIELYKGSAASEDETESEEMETDASDNVIESEAESSESESTEGDNGDDIEAELVSSPRVGSGVRPSGRASGGIRGIRLRDGAKVVALIVVNRFENPDPKVIIATANGYAKRMHLNAITIKNRAGIGIKSMGQFERNGLCIGAVLAHDNGEFMLITDQGQLLRVGIDSIPLASKAAGGVIAMRPYEGESVIALQSIDEDVVAASNKVSEGRAKDKQDLDDLEAVFNNLAQDDALNATLSTENDDKVNNNDGMNDAE